MLVVDASVLAVALCDDGQAGDTARTRLSGERLAGPELIDLEVISVLRRQVAARKVEPRRAGFALTDLFDMPLSRAPHRPLLARIWQLRENVTVYDAAYFALAEALEAVFLTGDARLTRAPGLRCQVELLSNQRHG